MLEVLINNIVGFPGVRGYRAIGGYYDWNRRRESVRHIRCLPVERGNREAVGLAGILVLPNGEIESVLVVGKRLVTDTETTAENGLLGQPVREPESRSEILVVSVATQILGVAINAGDHQTIDGGVIVRIPAGRARIRGHIKLPT